MTDSGIILILYMIYAIFDYQRSIWQAPLMPILAEKAILPLCVLVGAALIITNSMHFNWGQRLGGFAVVTLFAYLVANRLHLYNAKQKTQPQTSANIKGEILEYQPQIPWSTRPGIASVALLKVSLVNHFPLAAGIKAWELELIDTDGSTYKTTETCPLAGWSKAKKVSHSITTAHSATTTKYEELEDLRELVRERPLKQGALVDGWLAFAFKDEDINVLCAHPRLTLTDTLDNKHSIEGAASYNDKNKTEIVDTEE